MPARLRKALTSFGFLCLLSSAALAQMTTMEGDVKGPDGQPYKGAVIDITRTDIKGHYSVKSDKKGHWFYMGLPEGTYTIKCLIDGKVMDQVTGVKSSVSDSTVTNFDLHAAAAKQAALNKAAQDGQLSAEQEKGMSKEQKEQFEAAAKKQQEAMKKNKALNDTFTAGTAAMEKAKADTDRTQKEADYKTAVDSFQKAGEIDPSQLAVYENEGLAYYQLGLIQTGDDKQKSLDQALQLYQKCTTMKPDEGAFYIQIANIYGAEKKIPEAEEAVNKAVQLNPQSAGKAYYNLGASLVNSGHSDQATDLFRKATQADPNYAEAWYQLGINLAGQGTVDPKTGATKYPDGTADAYQKYLDLAPNGPHATEAKAMLEAMNQTVQTKTVVKQKR